ncbi:MAG: Holliday junction branch migration DNA helicase RuvB [Candidatus Wildermuthbacteria bacterium]|nr:Holliday junction branch migration DNA helicase RuvB [Candidatus Wildermuthbacteria bacterium]
MNVKGQEKPERGEDSLDTSLRPRTWEEYIGQEKVKNTLQIIIGAAKKRKDPLEHLLLYGNSGLGKTSLANVIAREIGSSITTCSGASLERVGDIASLLTNLAEGEVLFIDECHRLQRQAMETLYSAMEDYKLHLVIGKGPMARTMEISLPKFTLIAATTRVAVLPAPFRNRFGAVFQLSFYNQENMEEILRRSSAILGVQILPEAVSAIAQRSRFTPRVANRILKRVRDFATMEEHPVITKEAAMKTFSFLEIDDWGLEPDDRKILRAVIEKFGGGPVGIQALSALVAEEQDTILDVYEPYLLQTGLLERTPRGRIATPLAYKHLGISQKTRDLL